MNDELFARVLVQLEPELAQEFGNAILEDRKKLKALDIIKEKDVSVFGFINTLKEVGIEEQHYEYYKIHSSRFHSGYHWKDLTQEEFDLLKEALIGE